MTKFFSSKNINGKNSEYNNNNHNNSRDCLVTSDKKLCSVDEEKAIIEYPNDIVNPLDSSEEEIREITILLVDDEKYTRAATMRVIKEFLVKKNIGFVIIEAVDGLDAFNHLIQTVKIDLKQIDLVLSDLNMSPVGGLQLAKMISEVDFFRSKRIKFFLLSAGPIPFQSQYIDGYFEKPITQYCLDEIFSSFLYVS